MADANASITAAFDHHRGSRPLLRQTSTVRGYVFVGASLAGYAAANAFLYYLCTGSWWDFSGHSYRQALATPLTEMLTHPLDVFAYPWMIAVVGLLLAAVIFVPLVVAVLYRLWVSGLFVATVAVVGHAPLLAACLGGGCLLAAMTPLRSNQPFLGMLLGLAPALVYLFLMLYSFFDAQEQVLFPRDWVAALPFVLGLTLSVGAGAAVLGLARLTQFRPGVIWPVLGALLLTPALVFYARIGPVEMDYALIVDGIDPGVGEALFGSQTVEDFRRAVSPAAGEREQADPGLVVAAAKDLDRRRNQLLMQCDRFLRRYRPNERAPSVLWIRAVAPDVALDAESLRNGLLRYRSVGPSKRSAGAWQELSDLYPRSPQAMVAQERLGIEALRDRRMLKAWEHLHVVQSLLSAYLARKRAPPAPHGSLFAPRESPPDQEYYRAIIAEAAGLIWLMEVNKVPDGDAAAAEAFAEYMRLWPFQEAPSAALEDLARRFEKTELGDNFRFQAAMAEKAELTRALKLSRLAAEDTDGAIAANYELGRLAMRLGATPDWQVLQLHGAGEYFRLVPSGNPYYALSQQHLAWLAREGPPAR